MTEMPAGTGSHEPPRRLPARLGDGDLWWSFRQSRTATSAAIITAAIVLAALAAPWIAPHNPFDLASLNLLDSRLPPAWLADGDPRFVFGTDDQGRDVLSSILYGARISLAIGFASVAFAALLGVTLGLIAGYAGGIVDSIIMRVADVQLSFPAIMIALLIDGTAHAMLADVDRERTAFWVLVVAIGLSFWVQYARTVRGSTMVEKRRDYVDAARLIGIHPLLIMIRHILPNVVGPVLVIATINLAVAIVTEATLSFLGVGIPPTQPSLGTMIRVGQDFLFSGEWWIVFFPGVTLAVLVLAVNLLGDWLRDVLDPKLR